MVIPGRRRAAGLAVLAGLAVGTVSGAAAQSCGLAAGTAVAPAVGVADYGMDQGGIGATLGMDATVAAPIFAFRAGYRTVLLGGSNPHTLRGVVAAPLPMGWVPGGLFDRLALCGTGHLGGSMVAGSAETRVGVLAGGVGLRLAGEVPLPGGVGVPFAEVRGLGAAITGSALGQAVSAWGLSLGVEGGVQARVRGLAVRLVGTVDAFDPGLGATPYPDMTLEAAVELTF